MRQVFIELTITKQNAYKARQTVGKATFCSRSNIVLRMTRQKTGSAGLTFAFALACATAQAGPKSGSSEEPTYERRSECISPRKMTTGVTHRKGLTGVNSGVV